MAMRRLDRGSATLAAVLSAACFAMLAAQMAQTSRSAVVSVNAALAHARLAADADAGLALAVEGLTSDNPNDRWDLDRGIRTYDFNGAILHIVVEDERGKIPLNAITPAQVRQMFEKAGAARESLDTLVDAFLDFRDPQRVIRGRVGLAQALDRLASDHPPPDRLGGFRTVEEVAQIVGMTPALYAVLSPSLTAMLGGPFDARTATPLALAVMQGAASGPQQIERQREMNGERTALSIDTSLKPTNRALTVRVDAADPNGGSVQKATIIELTGHGDHPFVVRQQNPGFG